ncbi:hypothetical protein BDW22DRAFT_482001 [Trametopsis cervina]|nr:hypothetical protein BDW22DRAFT_482001 [Trametopsis cervina]
MSLSVDDLVASFSSSHIGQEQMDLAALQAQLAQILYHSPLASRGTGTATPVARTRSNSLAGPSYDDTNSSDSMMATDDDERMVEDLLFPSSPSSSSSSMYSPSTATFSTPSSHYTSSHSHYTRHSRQSSLSTPFPPPSSSSSHHTHNVANMNHSMASNGGAGSIFATTDPFYLAAQSQSQAPAPSSFLAQYARPQQQSSPFLKAHAFQPQTASAFVR